MILVTGNKTKRLLFISYFGKVRVDELVASQTDIKTFAAELAPGFKVLVNLSQLEGVERGGVKEIGRIMEIIDQSTVAEVVRVLPSSDQDFGINIMTAFHYRTKNRSKIVSFKSMAEAGKHLGY